MNKSKLNEIIQKNSLTFPEYDSILIQHQQDGNLNYFIGKCFFQGETFITDKRYLNKKKADDAVAEIVLNSTILKDLTSKKEKIVKLDIRRETILIIDLDNQSNYDDYFPHFLNNENIVKIIACGGPNTKMPSKDYRTKKCKIWRSNSTIKDAADIELVWVTCKYTAKIPEPDLIDIIIISKDYSLHNMVHLLANDGFNTSYFTSVNDFLTNFTFNE